MIKVGNILLDPNDISSIHRCSKTPTLDDERRSVQVIQIIYKSGVVKNITSTEVGMSYNSFIEEIQKLTEKQEDDKLFRTIVALKSLNNV